MVMSHPVWVCGLKQLVKCGKCPACEVTPCMGVWIETEAVTAFNQTTLVTPCMGVWIETLMDFADSVSPEVTPCMGVWIETRSQTPTL